MKRKLIAVTSITVLICMVLGNIVACTPAPTTEYDLTINSTEGGLVTAPGEGVFTYDEGTVVNLVAEAGEGYWFDEWTGDVGTIADVNDATTTITMNGDYSITPNFVVIYDLTISSTEGGLVTTPGEGTFTRDEGTVVDLVATPDADYYFTNWTGDVGTIANVNAATTTIITSGTYSITASFQCIPMVAAGGRHTAGVKSDGTAVAVGSNDDGQCDVGGWTDITQVAAGWVHTVGLKSDGTAVAAGHNVQGQCDVGGWTDIIQVAAGGYHTVGLKSDGTVVALGENVHGQCDVVGWAPITQVAAGWLYTVGLKNEGTVVDVGDNDYEQCEVGGWTLN